MTNKKTVLFVETGIVGGGSFESLYQTLKALDKERFFPVVVFLNRTKYYDLMTRAGIKTYLVTDLAYTKSLPSVVPRNVEKRADMALLRSTPFGKLLFRLYHGPLIFRLKKIIKRHGVDLLYLNTQINRDLFGCLIARDCGIPVVSHLRSMDGDSFTGCKLRLANETVEAYVSNSSITQRYWEERGIDRDRSLLVHNAVPLVDVEEKDVRLEFDIPQDVAVIGCVARLVGFKNHKVLLEAFASVLHHRPKAVLLLLGDGPEGGALRDQVDRLNISQSVIFAGHRLDARAMMPTLDMLVLPSDMEPFGRVLIEAMQVGVPVVGSDSGGILDIIEDGENGFLAPKDNAEVWATTMLRMLEDSRLRERCVQNGLRTVREKFDLAKKTAEIESIMEQALVRHKQRRHN